MKNTKWNAENYKDTLQEMKQTAHDKMWLYIEVCAKDLMDEWEPGLKNTEAAVKGMLESMLEGDEILVDFKDKSKPSSKFKVRYYVDNLFPSRRSWLEAEGKRQGYLPEKASFYNSSQQMQDHYQSYKDKYLAEQKTGKK